MAVSQPYIRAAFDELKVPVPNEPRALAELIGRVMDHEAVQKGLDYVLVFALRDGAIERWELRGELPADLDEVVRNIVRLDATAAAAIVIPGALAIDGVHHPAVHTIAEVDGRRARRALPLMTKADGTVHAPRALLRDEPIEAGAWIGVAPTVELGLHALGPDSSWGPGRPGGAEA